jgi:hypothetical protein
LHLAIHQLLGATLLLSGSEPELNHRPRCEVPTYSAIMMHTSELNADLHFLQNSAFQMVDQILIAEEQLRDNLANLIAKVPTAVLRELQEHDLYISLTLIFPS